MRKSDSILLTLLTSIFIFGSCGQQSDKSNSVPDENQQLKNQVLSLFESNLRNIEGESRKCEPVETYFLDMNGDSNLDAIVHYYWELTDGGNLGGSGFALFLSNGNELSFKGTEDNSLNFSPKLVIGNELIGELKEYAPQDPRCCPSITSPASLILNNGKLKLSKRNN